MLPLMLRHGALVGAVLWVVCKGALVATAAPCPQQLPCVPPAALSQDAVTGATKAIGTGLPTEGPRYAQTLRPYQRKQRVDHGLKDVLSPTGRLAKGIYITADHLHRVGALQVVQQLQSAHLNTVVVDLKDDWGTVAWRSQVQLSRRSQTPLLDPAALAKVFHQHGVYFIARLVALKDSRLPRARPDLAVRRDDDPTRLHRASRRGALWLDVYAAEVQDYVIDLALELEAAGVDEVQLDYIRFPQGRAAARWLHADGRSRAKVIAELLERLDRALAIPLSIDIFGLTTFVQGDPRGIGQSIEDLAHYVEAISPMMYANGMRSYFANNRLSEAVYGLLHCGLWRARDRAPSVVLRPFLQAYPNGVRSFWSTAFIVHQLEAAERAGVDGFLLWNTSMRYDVSYQALRTLGKQRLAHYGTQPEQYRRSENLPQGFFCRHPQQQRAAQQASSAKAGTL